MGSDPTVFGNQGYATFGEYGVTLQNVRRYRDGITFDDKCVYLLDGIAVGEDKGVGVLREVLGVFLNDSVELLLGITRQ